MKVSQSVRKVHIITLSLLRLDAPSGQLSYYRNVKIHVVYLPLSEALHNETLNEMRDK